jgi:hypothetical protein
MTHSLNPVVSIPCPKCGQGFRLDEHYGGGHYLQYIHGNGLGSLCESELMIYDEDVPMLLDPTLIARKTWWAIDFIPGDPLFLFSWFVQAQNYANEFYSGVDSLPFLKCKVPDWAITKGWERLDSGQRFAVPLVTLNSDSRFGLVTRVFQKDGKDLHLIADPSVVEIIKTSRLIGREKATGKLALWA